MEQIVKLHKSKKTAGIIMLVGGGLAVIPFILLMLYLVVYLIILLCTFWTGAVPESIISMDQGVFMALFSVAVGGPLLFYGGLFLGDAVHLKKIIKNGTVDKRDYKKYRGRFIVQTIGYLLIMMFFAEFMLFLTDVVGIDLSDSTLVNDIILLTLTAAVSLCHFIPSVRHVKMLKSKVVG